MEVARAMGLVEARPRTGLRALPYSFTPSVRQSLFYAISLNRSYFDNFADLRKHIETTYWYEAVARLTPIDHDELKLLVAQAWCKLRGEPIEIPQKEHRELHLLVYRRLNNIYVMGILEAYWDAYETVGLNVYTDYTYLQNVWHYHQIMVEAICSGDYDAGYQALLEHTDLIFHRSAPSSDPNV
jgi:DNA-binding FadR family transcriptional regulator